MRKLYVVGGGGFASEVLFVIERSHAKHQKWDDIFIIDDNIEVGTAIRSYAVAGNTDHLCGIKGAFDVIITINDTDIRKSIAERIKKSNAEVTFPNVIESSSIVDTDYLTLGEGNIIMAFVVLSTSLVVGDFNIFNSYTGIGHDTKIGNYNTFNPRVAISGNVTIGDLNNFGVNATVLQNKTIGSSNQIWMNSTIVKNIKSEGKYFGIPAKKIQL